MGEPLVVAEDITATPEVTQVTSKKDKDPKRIAQCKHLAKISREAKERKMRERIEKESKAFPYFCTNLLLAATTTIVIGYVLYDKFAKITKCNHKSNETNNNGEKRELMVAKNTPKILDTLG